MRPSPPGVNPLGILLVLLGVGLGLVISLGLYQWEKEARLQEGGQTLVSPSPTQEASPPTTPTPIPPTPGLETPTPLAQQVSFARDILPILQKSCLVCHGGAGGLTLTDYDSVMNTGVNQPLIIPGKPQESLFVKRLKEKPFMPPAGPLPDQEIRLIEAWIEQGAVKN